MKLLVSIDNSPHSRYAIEEITNSQWPADSEVMVATAVKAPFGTKPLTEVPRSAAEFVQNAAAAIKNGNSAFAKVESKVLLGDPKKEILALEKVFVPDLLVMGSRAPDFQKFLFGSVSHALFLASACSVRISRQKKTGSSGRIVLGLDASRFSRVALYEIITRPWPGKTEFICITAVPTVEESSYDFPDIFSMDELQRRRDAVLESATCDLKAMADELSSALPDCTVTSRLMDGDPREVLTNAAVTYNADLIIVGSRGLNFDAQVAVGSVSEAVAVSAPCSVEVAKRASHSNRVADSDVACRGDAMRRPAV